MIRRKGKNDETRVQWMSTRLSRLEQQRVACFGGLVFWGEGLGLGPVTAYRYIVGPFIGGFPHCDVDLCVPRGTAPGADCSKPRGGRSSLTPSGPWQQRRSEHPVPSSSSSSSSSSCRVTEEGQTEKELNRGHLRRPCFEDSRSLFVSVPEAPGMLRRPSWWSVVRRSGAWAGKQFRWGKREKRSGTPSCPGPGPPFNNGEKSVGADSGLRPGG